MTPSEERARLQEELREEIDKLGRLAEEMTEMNCKTERGGYETVNQ